MADAHPTLTGERVTLRPGHAEDASTLQAILAEPSVARWWGQPETHEEILATLRGEDDSVVLVIEVDGEVAGAIQYSEEEDPDYRHAGIDIYLGTAGQGQGYGTEAVALLAQFLIERRGHHRLVIDPAADNIRAIRCYTAVGFRPVGIMRQYERGADGTWHDGLLMDMLARELVEPP